MLNADPTIARPTLTSLGPLLGALHRVSAEASSPADIWRRLTDDYIVDLDAVAALLPRDEPEPVWLRSYD